MSKLLFILNDPYGTTRGGSDGRHGRSPPMASLWFALARPRGGQTPNRPGQKSVTTPTPAHGRFVKSAHGNSGHSPLSSGTMHWLSHPAMPHG